jgi:hypothetical protein
MTTEVLRSRKRRLLLVSACNKSKMEDDQGIFSVSFGGLWRKDKRNQRVQAVVKRWRMGYLVWARQV